MDEGKFNKNFICSLLIIALIISFIFLIKGYSTGKIILLLAGFLGYILTIPFKKFAPRKE